MYKEPDVTSDTLLHEDLDHWRVKLSEDANGQCVTAGIGVGIAPSNYRTLPFITDVKPKKQFVVIDGQVFINAAFIKENTL